jgi:hypothetical protein
MTGQKGLFELGNIHRSYGLDVFLGSSLHGLGYKTKTFFIFF